MRSRRERKQSSPADESFFSPSVLPQELVLELLQVLAQPLLLLSGFLELHHQLLPVGVGGGETPLLDWMVNHLSHASEPTGGQNIHNYYGRLFASIST